MKTAKRSFAQPDTGCHGITADNLHYSPPKDWITIALPVSKVESLLDTEYHEYRHEDGKEVVRTTRYRLPRHYSRQLALQPAKGLDNDCLASLESRELARYGIP